MARARRLEDELRQAEALRQREPGAETTRAILAALGHRSGLIVAAAARAAAALRCAEALPALLAALDPLYRDPLERDPTCHGKLAVVAALDDLGHADAEPFLAAVRHVQLEPVWGGREDSAPALRIRAAQALCRLGHHALYRILGDLLVDPVGEVRGAAAQLLGALGGERAALLLRVRVAVGEAPERSDVLADHLAALLQCDGEASLPLAAGLLASSDRAIAGVAALAIGTSRLAAGLPLLSAALERCLDHQLRRTLVDAIALLRSEAALDALLAVVADADADLAVHAATALRLYRDRPVAAQRIAAAVAARGERRIAQAWDA